MKDLKKIKLGTSGGFELTTICLEVRDLIYYTTVAVVLNRILHG